MKQIKRTDKYLAYAAAVFIGAASACLWGISLVAVASVLGVVSVFLFVYFVTVYKKKVVFSAVAAILAVVLGTAGVILGLTFLDKSTALTQFNDGGSHRLTGCVKRIIYESSYYSLFETELYTIDGESVSSNAVLETVGESSVEVNSVFIAKGVYSPLSDDELYLRADGIFATFECDDIDVGTTKRPEISDILTSFRDVLSRKLTSSVGGQAGALCSALLLGDRSGLSDTVKLDFRYAGASHILAISGMHLSIIMAAMNFVLRSMNKLRRLLILIPAALAYMALVGFSESVMRAAFMLTLLYASELLGQSNDSLTSLMISVAVIIAVKPYAAYDIGLWLSFATTFGIVVIVPEMNIGRLAEKGTGRISRALYGLLAAVLSLLAVTVTAYFFALPVTAAVYGATSFAFLLTAVTLLPLSELVLILALISVLTMYIPLVGTWVCGITAVVTRLLLGATDTIADIDGVYVSLDYPFTPYIIYTALAVVLIMLMSRRVKTVFTIPVIAAAFSVFIACSAFYSAGGDGVEYDYLTVNGNDAVCLISDGKTVLFDASSGKSDILLTACEYFSDNRVNQIDCLVLTHLHANHTTAIKKLMAQTRIKSILVPSDDGRTTGSDYATALDGIVSIVGDECPVTVYDKSFMCPAGKIEVERTYIASSTHPVIEFRVAGKIGYLGTYSADIGTVYRADYSVLILGAHGPKQNATVTIYDTDSDTVLIAGSVQDVYAVDDNVMNRVIFVDGQYKNSTLF
ncbi:MAG: ComEC/Rec2 family competence protein [Clostridia bacterium]|nr:ComEC/Rec2 family competence protein [Clostridia bacterium]